MDKIGVCIVGCGAVAEGHLKAWRKVADSKVLCVVDLNDSLAKKTADNWKITNHFTKLSDALSLNELNVVDIATPPQVHAPLAIEAMEAGKNVLIEKPMTMTLKDAQKVVDCYHKSGVKAAVLHNWLFDQPVLAAKAMVKEGRIGKVFGMEVEALQTKEDSMASDQHHWVHSLQGGRFSEMLAHPIYLLREFLGKEIEVEHIFTSKIGSYPWMKSDEITATFSSNGKIGRAYASFNSPQEIININLYGEKGIINLDLFNFTVRLRMKRKAARFEKGVDSLVQADQLIKCVAGNSFKIACNRWLTGHDSYIKFYSDYLLKNDKPPVSIEDGFEVVNLLDKMCENIVAEENLRAKK